MKPDKRMLKKFFYWISERHLIFLKRQAGDPWPWTKDKILRTYKFTNVFRELDAVTVELGNRKARWNMKGDALFMFQILAFRLFNWPPTYDALVEGGALPCYRRDKAMRVLRSRKRHGQQTFTGAYIITNSGDSRPKIELAADALQELYEDRTFIMENIVKLNSMEGVTKFLCQYPMMGMFTAYEVVCDFRHEPRVMPNA